MFGWVTAVGGFLAPHLFWIKIGVAAVLLGSVVTFVTVCHGRGIKLDNLKAEREIWLENRSELNRELVSRNERIKRMNEERLMALAVADAKLEQARIEARDIRVQRDRINAELARVLLENENDEAVLVLDECPVPGVAWERLRGIAASHGGT